MRTTKVDFQPGRASDGSVLVTTLLICTILGITLGGYLWWVRTQNLLVAESQAWNAALAVAEAGIEEGLAQINVAAGTTTPTAYATSAAGNWTYSGGVYGPVSRILAGGSYSAIFQPDSNTNPVIYSTGYTSVPIIGKTIARTVMVTTTHTPAFPNAITMINGVTNKGNGVTIDSYDSSDLVHFPGGFYNVTNRHAGGDVAAAATNGFVLIQNSDIYGKVRTAPTGGYSIGSNGRVGDLPVNWAAVSGVEPGWYINDLNMLNMDFQDVTPPYDPAVAKQPMITTATNGNKVAYTYNVGSGNYGVIGDLTLNPDDQLIVLPNNAATLYVTGNFIMNSKNTTDSSIVISNGASLNLYVGGGVATFDQINTDGNASIFHYYGLPGNTNLSWTGNAQMMGEIYAPEADLSLGGGGFNNMDYQGAMTARSLSMNGHFNIHFDENLRRNGPGSGFKVTSWREL